MQIFSLVLLLLGGVICLYIGAELLIIYAARLAISVGMTPLVVGLTVVAFSTSTPELASTLIAQINGDHSNMALGTIVGSNIANIGLILGLITMVKPLEVKRQIKTFEAPFTIGITLLLWVFLLRGQITRWMGIVLIIGVVFYVYRHIKKAQKLKHSSDVMVEKIAKSKRIWYFLLIAIGVVSLTIGGALLIKGAVGLATRFGIPDRVIGLTVVALGTSLPEFAASLVAIMRKLGDVAIGNILGSNVFNILFILGVVAIVKPLSFSSQFLNKDVPLLLAFSALLWGLVSYQKKLGRLSGLLLFSCYVGYIYYVS
ncbi:MAG: Inner membrane protein YrbG [Chlamydiae bacterium]|nr:Inner membrane protein YrbG [Chlamydiota bacterium]